MGVQVLAGGIEDREVRPLGPGRPAIRKPRIAGLAGEECQPGVSADVFGPSWSPQDRAAFTASQRAATDADVAADLLALIYQTDVRDELPKVRAPALVVHRDRDRAMRLSGARKWPRCSRTPTW